MKTLKKFVFFIITFNVIFLSILNLQYIYRFGMEDDNFSSFWYSSILPISFSIIPLVCFSISWFISKFLIQKLKINSILGSATILLITVILTYMFTEIMVHDSIWSFITVISTILTLFLFFYIYRKDGSFTRESKINGVL